MWEGGRGDKGMCKMTDIKIGEDVFKHSVEGQCGVWRGDMSHGCFWARISFGRGNAPALSGRLFSEKKNGVSLFVLGTKNFLRKKITMGAAYASRIMMMKIFYGFFC